MTLLPLLASLASAHAAAPPPGQHGEEDWSAVDEALLDQWPQTMFPKIFVHYEHHDEGVYEGCSGTMVGRYHLVTAGHCTFDPDTGSAATEILVIPSFDVRDNELITPFGMARVAESFTYDRWREDGERGWDQAYLLLDRPMGDYTGWVDFEEWDGSTPWDGEPVEIWAYPGDDPWAGITMTWGTDLAVGIVEDIVIQHLVDTSGGSSGAGLISRRGDDLVFIGSHSSSRDSDGVNVGVMLDAERANNLDGLWFTAGEPGLLADLQPWGSPELSADSLRAGATPELTFGVRNVGFVDSEPFIANIYLSGNDTVTDDDVLVGFATFLDPIGPMTASEPKVQLLQLPDNLGDSESGWRLGWILDPPGQVYEYDEGNNIGLFPGRLAAQGAASGEPCVDVLLPECDTDNGETPPSWGRDPTDSELETASGCGCASTGAPLGGLAVGLGLIGLAGRRRSAPARP